MSKITGEFLSCLCGRDKILYENTLGKMSVLEYLIVSEILLKRGHFVLANGNHSDEYINIRDLITIDQLSPIAMQIAYDARYGYFDTIVGTPHGADTLAVLVAMYYTVFTDNNVQVLKLLKNGDDLKWYKDHGSCVRGTHVLQIEDVVNSGGSLSEATRFIQKSEGGVLEVVAVANRRNDKNPKLTELKDDLGLQSVRSLIEIDVALSFGIGDDNPRDFCEMCKAGRKIDTRVGHGKEFLAQIKDEYPNLYNNLK